MWVYVCVCVLNSASLKEKSQRASEKAVQVKELAPEPGHLSVVPEKGSVCFPKLLFSTVEHTRMHTW